MAVVFARRSNSLSARHTDAGGPISSAPATPAGMPRFLQRSALPPREAGLDALAARAATPGAAVPAALRAPLEARLGSSLAAARLHRGPEVTAGLQALGTPAAALGRHVFLSSTAPAALMPRMLRHELAHVAQARLAEPDLGRPLRLGARGSAIERQAASAEGRSGGTPLHADANTLHRYDEDGATVSPWASGRTGGPSSRPREQVWRGAVAERAPAEVAARPRTMEEAIEQSKTSLLMQRGALFEALQRRQAVYGMIAWLGSRPIVPPDLLSRWVEAEQVAITLDTAAGGPDATYIRALAQRQLLAFFAALAPVLEAHEQEQREREAREKAEADAYNAQREAVLRARARNPAYWMMMAGGGATAGLYQLYPLPRGYYRAPAPASPGVRRARGAARERAAGDRPVGRARRSRQCYPGVRSHGDRPARACIATRPRGSPGSRACSSGNRRSRSGSRMAG